MKTRRMIYPALAWLISVFTAISQNTYKQTVSGQVTDTGRNPLTDIPVTVVGTSIGTMTDAEGRYTLSVPTGEITLSAISIQFKFPQVKISLKAGEHKTVDFLPSESKTDLQEVTVVGKTKSQLLKETPLLVDVIDTKAFLNSTSDLNQVLNRTSGVRIRETGGVGSDFTFSLNGFSGNQVRFFMDGVPMDNLGSSFQLNNIPVNLSERIEVFKGVVPVYLGADALGGAVNIVTNPGMRNYLDASYSFGSFNTHRTSVNASYTTKGGVLFQLNAFQNYSDNNYKVDVEVADLETGVYTPMRLKRFHDNYHNETVIAKVGLVDKPFADILLIGITLGKNSKEIQTGNRMTEVYGGRKHKGNIVMPSLRYSKKNLFTEGLQLDINGNYNLGEEQAIDTLARQYNWLGEYVEQVPGSQGGEAGAATLYKYKNNNGLVATNLSYTKLEEHTFYFNHTFNIFNRKGKDEMDPEKVTNNIPKKSVKNILGFSYEFKPNEKWMANAFVKEFIQHSTSPLYQDNTYVERSNDITKEGFGLAMTYWPLPSLQLKASYERSFRLPENEEIFGDEVNLASNYDLRPEKSDNFNFGANYRLEIKKEHRFDLSTNLIYRNTHDFIRAKVANTFGKDVKQMINLQDVTTRGIDSEIKYIYKNILTVNLNVTYQDILNKTKYEGNSTTVSPVYKDRIPNIPYLFGNGNISLFFDKVGGKQNSLRLDYNLAYVHEYYLRWPSQGSSDSKYVIPEQLAHDAALTYSLVNGQYNIALECHNLTDTTLYDDFSLQKPSRAFYIKLRYFIFK